MAQVTPTGNAHTKWSHSSAEVRTVGWLGLELLQASCKIKEKNGKLVHELDHNSCTNAARQAGVRTAPQRGHPLAGRDIGFGLRLILGNPSSLVDTCQSGVITHGNILH